VQGQTQTLSNTEHTHTCARENKKKLIAGQIDRASETADGEELPTMSKQMLQQRVQEGVGGGQRERGVVMPAGGAFLC